MEFIARDLRQISTVDGKGFQQLLSFVEPGYKPPSRLHINARCRRLYSSQKEELLQVLASQYAAITTDLWTSGTTESYLTITAHFINNKWGLENKVLLTREMPERHIAVHIADRLREAIKEWKIDEERVCAIACDNAKNMPLSVEKLGWDGVPCSGHTLQLYR